MAIINPWAGASRRHAEVRATLAHLRAAGLDVVPRVTRAAGEARTLAAEIAETWAPLRADTGNEPPGAVLAFGGDGTVREVAEGLAGSPIPMVIWPTGTENLAARSFGFRRRPRATLACLTRGRTIPVDLGQANGHAFLVVAGAGFDAQVVHRLTELRRGHITHLTYVEPVWRTFWEHRFPALRVLGDGQPRWQGRGMVFVGNLRRYALGLRVVRDARHDDGLLDVIALPCRGRLELISHTLRILARRQVGRAGVWYGRFRRVRIEAEGPVPVEIDGEHAGTLPLDLTVRPAAVRVRVPPGWDPR